MKEKSLIYLALEIRAVFLCAINRVKVLFFRSQFKISGTLRIFLIFILLTGFSLDSYADPVNCPSGQRFCRGGCKPARECRQGVPPPPGLPIDSKIPFLIIAGLGLGIYYVKFRKTA